MKHKKNSTINSEKDHKYRSRVVEQRRDNKTSLSRDTALSLNPFNNKEAITTQKSSQGKIHF